MAAQTHYIQSLVTLMLVGALITPTWATQATSNPGILKTIAPSTQTPSVTFPNNVFFMTPDGVAVYIDSGKYTVEAGNGEMRLTPVHRTAGETVVVKAKEHVADTIVNSAEVQLREVPAEHQDLQPLVLLTVDGKAYEAIGSKSGVWPRWGWSSIKKAAKKVGSTVKKGATAVGRAGKRVGRTVASGAKKVGKGVKSGYQAVRNQFCPSDPKPKKPFIKTSTRKYREANSFKLRLAYRWAPVHYQDTASDGKADYITNVDYDNDWVGTNNWDNLHRAPLRAYVYYSLTETKTHWFIMYMFFHPRDYAACLPTGKANVLGEHENDMEGSMAIVRKTNKRFGTLEGMVTVSHHDFYSYVPKGSPLRSGKETVDGTLFMTKHGGVPHPMTAQEAQGHGLKAWPQVGMAKTYLALTVGRNAGVLSSQASKKINFRGGDGVIYYPSSVSRQKAEIPSHKNDRRVEYALIDFHGKNGVWKHRKDQKLFTKNTGPYSTKFRGDTSGTCGGAKVDTKYCQANAANGPWGWDDSGDPVIGKGDGLPAGILATDPAKLVARYFSGEGKFSRIYIHNPFAKW